MAVFSHRVDLVTFPRPACELSLSYAPLCSVGASFLSKGDLQLGVGAVACVEWSGFNRQLLAGIGAGTVGTEKDPRPIMTLSC